MDKRRLEKLIYIRKIFKHDITHQVSIDSFVYERFFGSIDNMIFHFFDRGGSFSVAVRDPTDYRLGRDFKKMCRELHYALNDLLLIKKEGAAEYKMRVVKPNALEYNLYNGLYGYGQRHLILRDSKDDSVSVLYLA